MTNECEIFLKHVVFYLFYSILFWLTSAPPRFENNFHSTSFL